MGMSRRATWASLQSPRPWPKDEIVRASYGTAHSLRPWEWAPGTVCRPVHAEWYGIVWGVLRQSFLPQSGRGMGWISTVSVLACTSITISRRMPVTKPQAFVSFAGEYKMIFLELGE